VVCHSAPPMILIRPIVIAGAMMSLYADVKKRLRRKARGPRRALPALTRSAVKSYAHFAGLPREQDPKSPFVFTSERNSPFTTAGFARLVERAGEAAKLGFKAHPHMLRHACGLALANKGHDTRALQAYLGHKNIQHTVRYTELSPDRFKDFWR
jgi:site-specific recombinase XerD